MRIAVLGTGVVGRTLASGFAAKPRASEAYVLLWVQLYLAGGVQTSASASSAPRLDPARPDDVQR